MAIDLNSTTPYNPDRVIDPTRTYIDDRRSAPDLDNDLQPDSELAEGAASSTRVAIMAFGIAIVLGAVFYGLNNSSVPQQQASSSAPAPVNNLNSSTALPAAPPGMRDVTPRSNSEPGMTTGSAPANPGNAK
jgi:hypothetical protein